MSDTPEDSPNCDRNPSPPPEIQENKELLQADRIKNTTFSKRWLISTLTKLIEEVEREQAEEDSEFGLDVDEELQDELCKLWDMSMTADVAKFLQEFQGIEIMCGIISKSKAPRVVEICVGILGNMACDKNICQVMSENSKLIQLMLLLLDNRDPPTLVETTRLMFTSLSCQASKQPWISAIKDSDRILENLTFIFNSSTSDDLLKNAAEFVDVLLDQEEDLCEKWASPELLHSQLEAIKQIGCGHSDTLEIYFHIFQLFSTSEKGVDALVSCSERLEQPLIKYLNLVSEDEIVRLEGRGSCLASALSVLNILFLSVENINKKLTNDETLLRIFIKILEALYPVIVSINSAASATAEEKSELSGQHTREKDRSGDTVLKTLEKSTAHEDQVHIEHSSNVNTNNSQLLSDRITPGTSQLCDNVSPGTSHLSDNEDAQNLVDNRVMQQQMSLLFNIVRGFVVDLILSLLDREEAILLKVLTHMDTACSRQRLNYLVLTLQSVPESDINYPQCLLETAQTHNKERLERIIKDAMCGKIVSRTNSLPVAERSSRSHKMALSDSFE